ncbi:MAG TPA: NADPH-dependent FMN reductase, partial [Holophagaceae bacterium]
MRVLALSGSLRSDSLNARMLRAASRLAPAGLAFEAWSGLDNLPHFSPDRDIEPLPAAVSEIRGRIRAADGLLLCTPEYIHSMPSALKNLLEWVVSSGACMDKPTAVWSVSPSPTGGAQAQAALAHTLAVMSARVVPGAALSLTLGPAGLDGEGRLVDPALRERLQAALAALAAAGP